MGLGPRAVLAIAIVLALGGLARAAPVGFDHTKHTSSAPIACVRCHAGPTGLARPTHAACFTECHGGGAARKLVAGDRGDVCIVCHVAKPSGSGSRPAPDPVRGGDDASAARPAATFPSGSDLAPTLAHSTHATVPCAQCHSATPAKPHARCAGCHDGKASRGARMTDCASCHAGRRLPPAAPELPLAFSHARHAARSAAGKACATCHAAAETTASGATVPRAPLAACETCHDGKTAFATTAACTRCHDAAPASAWSVPAPGRRFSHASHGVTAAACATCHVLAASGEPTVASHASCSASGCHLLHPGDAPANDREAKEPPVCGACHEGTEPWRHLVADRGPPDATEIGASLDHGKHGAACTSCHLRRTPSSELRMPHGHAACSGSGCHAISGGPAPQLASCASCHRLALAADRLAARTASPWNVRATFDHARHGVGATACATCHTQLAGAQLLALPTPAKATCAPCHDGRAAFKLTGTTCRKCHAPPQTEAAANARM